MTAYLVARLKVKSPEAMAEYSQNAAVIIKRFGGKPILKGGEEANLIGALELPNIAVFAFPDREAVMGFYNSEDYRALLPLREAGADMVLSVHDAV